MFSKVGSSEKQANMEEAVKPHHIFFTNPVDLLAFLGQFVQIELENGVTLEGTIYTIDPVSQSLVLFSKEKCGKLTLRIVLKHSVTSMRILPEVPADQVDSLKVDILRSGKHSQNKNTKENVKNWLLKNMIPVVEIGDKLIVDTLEIYPPYGSEQCYCSNSIVLSRIQNLLKQIPASS